MDLPSVKTPALAVLKVLRANGHDDTASMLAETVGALDAPEEAESALAQLVHDTHMKWLGDVNMDWRDGSGRSTTCAPPAGRNSPAAAIRPRAPRHRWSLPRSARRRLVRLPLLAAVAISPP